MTSVEKTPRNDEPEKATSTTEEAAPEPLPKLSPQDFRAYNRMAEHMDMFHANFRHTWELLHKACRAGKRPQGMSIRQFLGVASEFCQHLTVHHGIEERHIFPVLARRMPAFRAELHLLGQHREIHKGIDALEAYIAACRDGSRELRLAEMGAILDSFGAVLWAHLDDEVRQLGAENMRRFWSLEEMAAMPM